MNSSLKLFAVRGIDIRLHITFPFILLWAAFQFGMLGGTVTSAVFGVVAISLLFVLVTLHELGHSFAALHYGVPVKQIVLSPIGGVAQLKSMPDKPVQELVIAAAGPAVNVVIALVMGLAAFAFGIDISNPLAVLSGAAGFTLTALFGYIFFYNVFLAAFNLIPAFPMDGGRIFRALLALRLEYAQATRIAAGLGRGLAVLLGFYGLFNGGIFLTIIAVFIYMNAGAESRVATLKQSLQRYRVRQAYSAMVYRITPYNSLEQAVNLMMSSGQAVLPVTSGDQYEGLLPRNELMNSLRSRFPHSYVENVMRRDIRPVTLDTDLFTAFMRMQEGQVEALPVVENGRFLGLISRQNLDQVYTMAQTSPKYIPNMQSETI